MSHADVVIVGGGPAGLSAAIELRHRGAGHVVVVEREQHPGGVPRHTTHLGYGMTDLHRLLTGPRYAATLVRGAERAGVEIQVGRTVQSLADGVVHTTGASGPSTIATTAVVLATGVRERPRAARLVPGDRPAGVLTTGALQQFSALHHQQVGHRAVVVGAEHVSFSAAMSLHHSGCAVAAIVTPLPRHQTYAPLRVAATLRHRVPVRTGVDVAEIVGRGRVEAVLLTDGTRIECDTVIFTGDWVPDHELARRSDLPMLPTAKSPVVDTNFHTERRGVFAVGNLVHPAETSGLCALSGRVAAVGVMDWLHLQRWPEQVRALAVQAPLRWAAPTAVGLTTRVGQFVTGRIEVCAGDEVLHRTRRHEWVPNRAIHLPERDPAATLVRLAR